MRILHNEAEMRIDWIEDLVALLDSGGVADAARLRNLTQPAFSRRIKVLEDVLGIDVIDRSVKPSGPSAVLRDHETELRKLASDQRLLLSEMRREQNTGLRQLVIASQHAITTSLGTQIINAVTRPSQTHIRLRSANRDECETLLLQRQAEIAVTYRIKSEATPETASFLAERIIGSDNLIPVCDAAHHDTVLAQFAKGALAIIGYPTDVFLGAALSRHILPVLESQCQVSVITETGLSTAALQLAQSGLGVAWVPHELARPALSRGEMINLQGALGGIDMEIVAQKWATTPNATTREAWDRLTRSDTVTQSGESRINV